MPRRSGGCTALPPSDRCPSRERSDRRRERPENDGRTTMSEAGLWRRVKRVGGAALTALLVAGGPLAPVRASAATPTTLSTAICGTWVLQQVSSVTELNNYKTQIDNA